jgi:hypothetical protein
VNFATHARVHAHLHREERQGEAQVPQHVKAYKLHNVYDAALKKHGQFAGGWQTPAVVQISRATQTIAYVDNTYDMIFNDDQGLFLS